MVRVSLEHLHELITRALVRAGTDPSIAQTVADALIAAEGDGLRSHGLGRVKSYAGQVVSGKVDGKAEPELSEPAGAVIKVDAKSGFAYPAIKLGLDRASELVKENGVACVSVGNSHHSGAFGYHVERMAERGLFTLAFSNSPAGIAPWGGKTPLFGTNPVAFGCPRRDHLPFVVDLSLAKVARGKIKMAADKGESIPEGWAVDAAGNPTTDAKAAMQGSNIPLGDAKGYALVLVVEILSAVLTGSNFGWEATSFFTVDGPPPHVGQLFIVFDAKKFAIAGFEDRIDLLFSTILEQSGTRLPGERRLRIREDNKRYGVEVDDQLMAFLKTI
ncbi:MAG: hypothetical protein CBB68_10320 [Rhodospirillaceae bacterium TMED8]|nr:sulfolactate dehydrogenase [Magnetovibrio sp.]OUT50244.1 MAG: hypothetical protein CBB68_10320 [Rhodospirillaceae bacterium TMED8]